MGTSALARARSARPARRAPAPTRSRLRRTIALAVVPGAPHEHRSARSAAVPPQPHQHLHGRLVRPARATHLPLHDAMPHHDQRPAQRPRCSPAARAYARPRCRARRHTLAPGLDPERAYDESMGASFSFDGCEARRERARPSKETPSSVTNFWLVLSFRAAAYTRPAPLNIPLRIQPRARPRWPSLRGSRARASGIS
jgi:hypothetical protein